MRKFGWKPDVPDHRDALKLIAPMMPGSAALPKKVDLQPNCPPVYDQANLGSCTANAIGAAVEFEEMLLRKTAKAPSRLFVYYNTRAIEGSIAYDSGASIRDVFKAVNKYGYCAESLWIYDTDKFKKRPPGKCYVEARPHCIKQYARVPQNLHAICSVIADKSLVVFGFNVYESFMSDEVARTGIVPMPALTEKSDGGHAVALVGYDDDMKMFKVRNSWGTHWGDKGYFWMPYDYVLNNNLSDDFWAVTVVP